MSEVKVNKISPRTNCGTVTLGDSGDTFSIPAGVTLTNSGTATGFGPTGAVSWDTTKKTTGFTAVSGVGYFCDTTGGAFTATLPATPTAGDIVAFKDYSNTFATNNLTIGRNGSNIEGLAIDSIQNIAGQSITLIYIDATEGWSIIYSAQYSDLNQVQFVAATGGTITTCGDYKIHSFTGPGTFTVTCAGNPQGSSTVDYLVVAGGGGGGGDRGGGGGAGGFRESVPSPAAWTASPLANPGGALPVSVQGYPITVGAGGAGGTQPAPTAPSGVSGNQSIFSTITSAGGGGGKNSNTGTALAGGSGGGGSGSGCGPGGAGNTPPTSPSQGNPGGQSQDGSPFATGAGGGGAGAAGGNASAPSGISPAGGAGVATSITGSSVTRAGGGGSTGKSPAATGAGGAGGGGAGSTSGTNPGTVNTGGGGGASCTSTGGAGGSGIVVIRYKFQ